jgi:protein-tyrosine phosphatase
MMPLVDMHCHLLAGLDDGPRTAEDALAMCRIAYDQGVRQSVALAHQNPDYPDVTPDAIRAAARDLASRLKAAGLAFDVFPCAEVMVGAETEDDWDAGRLLSVADRGQYVLLEMPHNLFLDLRRTVERFCAKGVRPILAHAERYQELIAEPGAIESLIAAGCLVQVNSRSVTDPTSGAEKRALRDWFRRGVVHLLGSDGHSTQRRPPHLADAHRQVSRWAGPAAADRVGSILGAAILQGLPLRVPPPQPPPKRWLPRIW